MSSVNVNAASDFASKSEFKIYDLGTELISEICSNLGAHDQLNMKRTCKWWKLNLFEAFLSRLVDMDNCRMPYQSEELLEHALNMLIKKNTKILVLRHFDFTKNKFGIVARVIQQKHADLMQLILKDCEVQIEFATAAYWWLKPDRISNCMMHGLLFATKKLILENYTVQNAVTAALTFFEDRMPCSIPRMCRQNIFKDLPITLPRQEFDCTKPSHQHYQAFIMALNSNCPEVCPEIRNEVLLLYDSWIHSEADDSQWSSLGEIIKCLHDGVPVVTSEDVNVNAVRELDPRTLNKLTLEALHRLYF